MIIYSQPAVQVSVALAGGQLSYHNRREAWSQEREHLQSSVSTRIEPILIHTNIGSSVVIAISLV